MIGIGKPIQFGRDVCVAAGSGDFVGFSGFTGPPKAKKARIARRSPRASRSGGG